MIEPVKKILPLAVGVLVWLLPTPEGLTVQAWAYFALFIGVVVALVTEPIPAAVSGLIGVVLAVVLQLVPLQPGAEITAKSSLQWGLSGFQNGTVWLIFSAYIFSLGYQKTGLGRRIALHLIKLLGRKSIGLGYAVALADLALAPFIPSNTARSGGTIYPIASNIPPMYGSTPDEEPRKIGSYLYWTAFSTTCVTSSMFLTGLAPNLLALSIIEKITGHEISWINWWLGFLPIGLLLFFFVPLLNYLIYPPSLKQAKEMPEWATQELNKLGQLTRHELMMAGLAVLALVLWIFGGELLSSTTAGLTILCLMILTGVINWSDIISHKQAWNVLVWFATLVTLAGGLSKTGFLAWLADSMSHLMSGYDAMTMMVLIIISFFLLHYFFASITAHVTALLPVFLTLAMTIPDMPIIQLSMLLCFTLGIMGVITPYAAGPGPIWYGSGYIPNKDFWVLGFILGIIFLATLLLVGIPWLHMMNL
ncbi:anion permease [Endozoicomonas sp. Mp262]|uniref:anion permease n=1 Tax=Endozoicomonas sp. Mp262 TaxID=2919499 RepID=UPI0021DAA18F